VDVLREGIFEVAARTCNTFIWRRIARTRDSLRSLSRPRQTRRRSPPGQQCPSACSDFPAAPGECHQSRKAKAAVRRLAGSRRADS
jgi:hypothetical protein